MLTLHVAVPHVAGGTVQQAEEKLMASIAQLPDQQALPVA